MTAWTDGAVRDGTGQGGAGCLVCGEGWEEERSVPAGLLCSSTQAEKVAMAEALEILAGRAAALPDPSGAAVTVVSDSQPTLFSVRRGPLRVEGMQDARIWRALGALARRVRRVQFQYVPSHVGIAGNERADELAGIFADAPVSSQCGIPVAFSVVKARVRRLLAEKWLSGWDVSHPHTLLLREGSRRESKCPPAGAPAGRADRSAGARAPLRPGFAPLGHGDLSRRGEVEIARLRTRHHHLLLQDGWVSRSGRLEEARCPDCGAPSSVAHLLRDCPLLPSPWRELLSGRDPGWWVCKEPHMALEYLSARGWLRVRRGELFAGGYLREHPGPPVTPGEALVIDVDAWTSSTSCCSDGGDVDSDADSASDAADGSSPARSDFTVEEAGLFF